MTLESLVTQVLDSIPYVCLLLPYFLHKFDFSETTGGFL